MNGNICKKTFCTAEPSKTTGSLILQRVVDDLRRSMVPDGVAARDGKLTSSEDNDKHESD